MEQEKFSQKNKQTVSLSTIFADVYQRVCIF